MTAPRRREWIPGMGNVEDDCASPLLYEALLRQMSGHSKGGGRISVTQLLQPPQIQALRAEHMEHLIYGASESIYMILGSATHSLLEGLRDIPGLEVEVPVSVERGDTTITGRIDLIDARDTSSVLVADWKLMSVWEVNFGLKAEKIAQLNLYAHLLRERRGLYPHRLQILGLLRDWSKSKAASGEHPPTQDVAIDVPLWPAEQAEAFLTERLAAHAAPTVPPCTREERWCRDDPERFAAEKRGRSRAVKLFDTAQEAHAWLAEQSDRGDLSIVRRPAKRGPAQRCLHYCPVRVVCPQAKED